MVVFDLNILCYYLCGSSTGRAKFCQIRKLISLTFFAVMYRLKELESQLSAVSFTDSTLPP